MIIELLGRLFGTVALAATFRIAAPLILSAMGGCFGKQSGIFNIALESFMLSAAFFAVWGSYLTQDPMVGLIMGIGISLVFAVVFGVLVLNMGSDPTVVGIAMNYSAWGFTTLLLVTIFNTRGAISDPRIKGFPSVNIPILEKIPYINDIFNNKNILVYVAYLTVIVAYVVLFKTPFGLRMRGIGINEIAAQTGGTNVLRYRWIALLITGVMCGVAGAFLPLSGISMFTEEMTAGRGYLVVAAIVIGRGNPAKVFLSCMLFAYAEALSIVFQQYNVPSQIIMTLPYVSTIAFMFVISIKNHKTKLKMI